MRKHLLRILLTAVALSPRIPLSCIAAEANYPAIMAGLWDLSRHSPARSADATKYRETAHFCATYCA
jgi:hypothetical protein